MKERMLLNSLLGV